MDFYSDIVETPRLILKPFQHNDLARIHQIYSNANIMRFIDGGVRSLDRMKQELKQFIDDWDIQGLAPFAVIYKPTNQLIGRSGLYFNTSRSPYPQLGYVLAEAMQGQGLATECAKASLNYGFARGFQRIDGFTHSENYASITVLNRKLGMTLIDDNFLIGDICHYQFALTLEQYQTMQQQYNHLVA